MQENVYDNLGQLVETVRYGAPINRAGLNGGPVNDALKLALAAASNANGTFARPIRTPSMVACRVKPTARAA